MANGDMRTVYSEIKKLAEKKLPRLIKLRRWLHAHPELAFQELQTSRLIQRELRHIGIKPLVLAKTGVVGVLKGSRPGPVCAIRSDMDALPIEEQTGLAFKSIYPGRMHACGHDVHMAACLGAAMILRNFQSDLKGTVKFIFQPAEEVPPGGAVEMIARGVLKNPRVQMIFALHSDPTIPVGRIGCREGIMMSAVLDFDLTIIGRGGHGARPHDTVDAILVAAQLISQLQTIISRNISPNSRAVLTIGTIAGGTARNVIAGEVQLKGTIRGTTLATVDRIRNRLERLSGGLAAAYGAAIKIKFNACYPVLVNDPEANRIIMETAGALYGKKNVIMISEPSLGGEDFAQYLQISAGAMFRLGVRNRRIGAVYNWHSDRFNADDRAVAVGAAVLAGAVVNFLSGKVD